MSQNEQTSQTLSSIQQTQTAQGNTMAQMASVEMGLVDDVYALKRANGSVANVTSVEEEPVGLVDGSNQYYTLTYTPVAQSLKVSRAGLRMTKFKDFELAPADYLPSPNDPKVIKFYNAPDNVNLLVNYDTTETVT